MEYKKIDYTNVKEKIVEQAYASAHTLNEEQKRKLIQDKFDRAETMYNALRSSPLWRCNN